MSERDNIGEKLCFIIINSTAKTCFIVVFSIIPFLTHIVKEADKELVAERQLEEKQKVCVDTDVLVKPDLTYKIKVCSNESVELLSINGKAIAKENN